MNKDRLIILILFAFILSGCSSGRYQDRHDSIPTRLPNQAELKDAIARAEPYSRGGNKNYNVRGIDYQVLKSAQGFEQIGVASWYGKKFHGHLTSNGEIYDMYAMSAAHKNLPLPTYLKVTNLANNKSVIVRANDRGPFHQNRIIDLSYSAAYKLDMLKTGTATVKITAITEFDNKIKKSAQQTAKLTTTQTPKQTTSKNPVTTIKNHIQVFATSKLELAQKTALKLSKQYSQPVNYPVKNGIYRIQIGPIANNSTLTKLLLKIKQSDYPNAYLVSL